MSNMWLNCPAHHVSQRRILTRDEGDCEGLSARPRENGLEDKRITCRKSNCDGVPERG